MSMQVLFDHSELIARNTRTFWFKASPKPSYIAGQFIEMTLPHDHPDSRGQKHWFTLSSSPTEPLLSITTKHDPNRSSTFKRELFSLKPHTPVTISEPMGDFVLPIDQSIPLVFIAGGIGITPARSMTKWLIDNHERRDIHIIYNLRGLADVAFRDLFESYQVRLDIILSEQTTGWSGRTGQLSAEVIMQLIAPDNHSLLYISGPEPMVEKLEAELKNVGIPAERLVLDFFPGYPSP